ncbi:MAG TPA: SDR family oxidoreductase [Firmicutes bacterium]|nr:SDR family oxidoreductase [Bacillota bacterium]
MILVTGATGHIGNVLVRELIAKGESVRALVMPSDDERPIADLPVDIAWGNVLVPITLERALEGIDTVYHLAGLVSIAPGQEELLESVNVGGTRNVIEACMKMGVRRLVYCSSIHAIVEPPPGIPIDESCGFDPSKSRGDYDRSKARASLEVLNAVEQGLDAVIVCPTGVIGPYDYLDSIMGQVIRDLASNSMKVLPAKGGYDFVDVRDVAAGLILAAEKGRTGEAYILSGNYIDINSLGALVDELCGQKPVRRPRVPMWLVQACANCSDFFCNMTGRKSRLTRYSIETLLSNANISSAKARQELGYSPRPLRESIADTLKWMAESDRLGTTA